MFEDTNKSPQPIEDIFSDTEVIPIPAPSAPGVPSSPPPPPIMPTKPIFVPPPAPPGRGPQMPMNAPTSNKGLIIGIVIVIAVILLGTGYWFVLKPWLAGRATEPPEVNVDQPPEAPSTTPSDNIQPPVTENEDTDGDRLNNQEEYAIGTDPNNPDTDNDGLFDGEEVLIYQTNPLNSDTDGDTYTDGEEVRNNYDPNGPGRLLNLPDGELNFQELDSLLQNLNEETT